MVVFPRVRPGLDRHETPIAVVIGQGASGAGEVRIDRRWMLVSLMDVSARGIGLPNLNKLAGYTSASAVEKASGHFTLAAARRTALSYRHVRFRRVHVAFAGDRRPQLDACGIGGMQFFCGMAKHTAAIGRIVQTRLIFDAVGSHVLGTDLGDFAVNVALAGQRRWMMRCGGACFHSVTV